MKGKMTNLVQFKHPVSQFIGQSGTKVQKAIANACPNSPKSIITSTRTQLSAKTGTIGRLITFRPNSKSNFAQAGYDQILTTKQPQDSGLVTNLISLFKNGLWVRDLWMEPNGKFSTIENSIKAAKDIGLSVK